MKKRLYLIAAAALALVACAKEEAYQSTESTIPGAKRIVLGASFELPGDPTKSDYDADGNFTWSNDDAIWIGSNETNGDKKWGSGPIIKGQSEIGPGHATAQFDCTLQGDVTAIAAVFPKTVEPSYSAGTLSLTLPATIAWTDTQLANPANATMQVDNIMVARYVDIYSGGYAHGTTQNIQFHNVGGLFCLTLKNVPAGADKLVFTADKKINGTFTVSNVDDSKDGKNYPVIATAATETESEKSVTITFPTISNGENKMTFFIPVPVGSYVIGFDVQNAEAKSLWAFSASKPNAVERGYIIKMPTLSHVIVGGSGDGATNIITTPTGFSGTVNLPSTNNSIYVRMNQTGGAITLAYADAPALHPANVYLQALGNVETLNINLPDSHVELTGEDAVQHVITNVSSYTSYSTLKVDKKVKIGKDEDKNSGITITGGSLDLDAPVEGKVTVNIPAANNNKTEEKVAINITSAIKDLVVTRAADNVTPADKVYVSLGNGASVAETIDVPEVNCNLYVAPGVTVKVIDTKAAENTVEGDVQTLSASGASTIVTVTEKADVTKSISATQGATVIVDNNALKDENNNTYNTTQTKDGSSTISTVDGLVATIGSAGYSSLDSAVEAATDGATITIIKEGNFTIPAIAKNLTIVGGVEGVNVNHTGASAVTTITSGNTLTLKNLALNLDKSFYQGFGTSGTGANAGALVMENCSIDGSLSLFGVSTFKNCTFTANDANAGAYNIWAVYSNATFTGCSFTNTNRAVNVYDPACGSTRKTVTFENCSFTASEKKKAAINIHHNPAPVQASGAKFDVVITDCTTSGTWASSVAETGEPADATICNSALWMVSDIENWTNGDITVNGVNVYDAPVAQIGTTTYTTLEAAVAAAQSDDTITLISDVDLSSHARSASDDIILEGVTLDLNGKTIRGYNSGVRYSGTGAVIKNGTFGFVDSEQKPNYGLSIGSYTAGATISDNITLENIKVVGGINIDLANVTMNNVDIDMTDATFYAIWVDEDGAVATYNSGTINGGANATAIFGVAPPTGDATDAIRITGGTVKTNGEKFRLTGKYLPVEVSGGLFDVQVPADCCAEGYEPTTEPDANGMYTVTPAAPKVAKIGDSYYATIADAVAAANKLGNVTINLLRDYDFEANEPGYGYTTSFLAEGESTARNNMLVVSGNSITFDLGGHTISNLFNNTFSVTGNNVVFQNGEMRVGQLYYSNLNGTTIYTSENDRTCSYIVYVQNATNFTVNNLTTYGGINVSGSTATINDLSFSGTKFYAVCSQSNSAVTLNGGTYTKAITGATGNLFWIEDGSTMNITGGTYTKGNASFKTGANPVITGGTFDFNPSAYVAAGYEAVQSESGNNWNVVEKTTPAYWIDNAADDYESVDNDNKVITIATAAQLAKLAKDIKDNDTGAGGTSTFEYLGYTFKLTADIDLGGKIWTPIGADLASPYSCIFRGTFDGNNHTISNMNAVHNEYAGLFGPLHSGYQLPIIIKDLTIKNFVVESNHFAGGIAAWFNRGGDLMSITNCSVIDGTITSSPEWLGTEWDNGDKVGGICGYVYDGDQLLTIKSNTVRNVNITAYRDFGGLIGAADGLEVTENTISNVNLYQNNTNAYKSDAITTYDAVVGKKIANSKACNIHDNTVANVKKYTGTPGAYTEVQ